MTTGPRRPVWPAVVLPLLLVAAVSACDRERPPDDPPACAVPTAAPPGTEKPAARAPGGGGLEVVDHGFTQIGGTASLGGLVRNTSRQIAYRTAVVLRLTDREGRDPVHEVSRAQLIIEIPVVRPGEQVAVASWAGMRTDLAPSGTPAEVATFTVELGSTRWVEAGDAAQFPAFTSTVTQVERSEAETESGQVGYAVTTTSCRPLVPRGAAAVFFGPAGSVVGGTLEPGGGARGCGTTGYEASISANRSIPPGIDEARTLVSVYCDLAAPASGFRPSAAPIN